MYFAGTDGAAMGIPGSRILSHPQVNFGGFGGIMGMPAMAGRTVQLDLGAMIDPESEWGFEYIGVAFGQQIPASNGHRYQAPLTLVDYPTGTGVVPTYAPIPFIEAQARNGEHHAAGSFVVDTGAQLSGISTPMAIDLGLDTDGDGDLYDETDTFMPITGINGTVELPVLKVPRLLVATTAGVDLVWTDLEVIVVDVDESIDGIFGMDLLVSGWAEPMLELIFLGATDKVGYTDRIQFDFRQASASISFDLCGGFDQVLYPGDANGDGLVDVGDLGIMATSWGSTPAGWAQGDFTDDGLVDVGDLGVLAAAWGLSIDSPAALPEPASLALVAGGAGCDVAPTAAPTLIPRVAQPSSAPMA